MISQQNHPTALASDILLIPFALALELQNSTNNREISFFCDTSHTCQILRHPWEVMNKCNNLDVYNKLIQIFFFHFKVLFNSSPWNRDWNCGTHVMAHRFPRDKPNTCDKPKKVIIHGDIISSKNFRRLLDIAFFKENWISRSLPGQTNAVFFNEDTLFTTWTKWLPWQNCSCRNHRNYTELQVNLCSSYPGDYFPRRTGDFPICNIPFF